MANVPKYDTRNFSFGAGILYVAPYDIDNDKPIYPYIDVGAVKPGSVLRINRDILDVVQGTPDLIVKSFVKSESIEFSIPSIEWNLENIQRALGGGEYNDTLKKLRFGGSMDLDVYSLMFVHEMPSGDKIKIKIWKANPTGAMEINFGNDDVHQFEMNFRALKSFYGWSEVDGENITDNSSGDSKFTDTLANTPVVPYSVTIKIAGDTIKDDGKGNLVKDGANVGTINYSTGEIEIDGASYDGQSGTADYATYVELSQNASMIEIEKIVS